MGACRDFKGSGRQFRVKRRHGRDRLCGRARSPLDQTVEGGGLAGGARRAMTQACERAMGRGADGWGRRVENARAHGRARESADRAGSPVSGRGRTSVLGLVG